MMSACLFTWTLVVAAPAGALAETPQEDAMLQAVVEYADNVLRFSRDNDTPLFADGLHVDTRQPAEFDGWALSNLADQQNLFRVLAGLTRLSGDPRYVNAAQEAVAWHFERQHPSGLLNWGHHRQRRSRLHHHRRQARTGGRSRLGHRPRRRRAADFAGSPRAALDLGRRRQACWPVY